MAFITKTSDNSITVIKKNNIVIYYIYNDFYRYKISISNKIISNFSLPTETIYVQPVYERQYDPLFINNINRFLYSLNCYFFEKIRFIGKGYRITFRKKVKIIKFHFGHSHITWVLFRTVKVKQPHKYKFVIYKNNFNKLKILNKTITNIKPMNLYTRRGIRNARQIIGKKKGKKNQY